MEPRRRLVSFSAFPKGHWQKVWSNNPIEWLNNETKRRVHEVEIFPNPAAFLRLATSVVIDQHDEWQLSRRHLSKSSKVEPRRVIATNQHALDISSDHDQSGLVDHCA